MAGVRAIYLDSRALQRPLDGLARPEEVAEAECVLVLLQWCASGRLILLWSDALAEECIRRMPAVHARRLRWIERVRGLARAQHAVTGRTFSLGAVIQRTARLTAIDALHVACAFEAHATFVTVDRTLLHRARRAKLKVRAVSPIELVSQILREEGEGQI